MTFQVLRAPQGWALQTHRGVVRVAAQAAAQAAAPAGRCAQRAPAGGGRRDVQQLLTICIADPPAMLWQDQVLMCGHAPEDNFPMQDFHQ